MKTSAFGIAALLFATPAFGQSAAKIGAVNLQKAVIECSDGKRAVIRLRQEFEPSELRLNHAEAQIKADRAQLDRDSKRRSRWLPWRHALSARVKSQRLAAIARRERDVVRERDDLQQVFDRERTRVVNEIEGRMKLVMAKYSAEQGYSEIRMTPGPAGTEDVTEPIVSLYDQSYPGIR